MRSVVRVTFGTLRGRGVGTPSVVATEPELGHIAAIIIGVVMMVIGLGLGVTMIMLPAGIVIGLLSVAVFVGGLVARISQTA